MEECPIMVRLLLYIRTIRRLTCSQIYWRLRYLLRRRLLARGAGRRWMDRLLAEGSRRSPMPLSVVDDRSPAGFAWDWVNAGRPYYRGDLEALKRNSFTFLSHTESFDGAVDWRRGEADPNTRLWKFTLYYQEYLVDAARRWRAGDESWGRWLEDHVREWWRQNPLGLRGPGSDSWHAYCISLRVVSWMRVWRLVGDRLSPAFRADFLLWLWVQCRFLADNVEWDILGNHTVKNWKALVWAGAFFGDSCFTRTADRLWRKVVRPQFAADGLHEELTPMYGAIVFEDVLEGLSPAQLRAGDGFDAAAGARALARLHFGTSWAMFNDSADGMAPLPDEVVKLYETVMAHVWPKVEGDYDLSAFIGATHRSWRWALACGPAVRGRQPGHVHACALSLELAVRDRKILSNAGVYEYNPGARRVFARSAAAHNTASVEGREFHEFWSSFRCARTGSVARDAAVWGTAEEWQATATSYDGAYRHTRILCRTSHGLRVADAVAGTGTGVVHWRLAEGLAFRPTRETGVYDVVGEGDVEAGLRLIVRKGLAETRETKAYPAYGREATVQELVVTVPSEMEIEVMEKKIVLASGSPRRAKILEAHGRPFAVLKTDAPEVSIPHDPARTVCDNAVAKLRAAQAAHPLAADEAGILAADTIVWFNGRIYGKPRDLAEAAAFLRELSGQTHVVFTGVAFAGADGVVRTEVVQTPVTFHTLSESAIADYVQRVKPTDRAGAYDIDESGDCIVASYAGSYENIMGLDYATVSRLL